MRGTLPRLGSTRDNPPELDASLDSPTAMSTPIEQHRRPVTHRAASSMPVSASGEGTAHHSQYIAVALGVFGTLTVSEVIASGGTAIAVAAQPVLGRAGYGS